MTRFSFVLAVFAALAAAPVAAQDAAAAEPEPLLVPVEPEPAPVIIVVEVEEDPAADPAIVEPAPAPAPIVAAPPALEVEPEPDVFAPGPFSIGLSALIGTREDPRHDLAVTWTGGLDLALSIAPWARVAIRRVGYSQAQTLAGDRHAISLSPAFELGTFVHERIEPYVQLGAAMQVRFGGEQDRAFGLAPFLDAGLRFYPAEWISISAEGALHVPVTSSFLLGHEIIPQGAFALQGGLAVAFHL